MAWPLSAFLIGWLFRKEIRARIPFAKKVGPAGVEFQDSPQPTTTGGPESLTRLPPSVPSKLQEFEGLPRTELMAEIEKNLLNSVRLVDSDKQVGLLVRALAQSRLEAVFERGYAFIFGSQVLGLRTLRDRGGEASLEEGKEFFENTKKEHLEFYAKSTFLEWFSYLSNNGFAVLRDEKIVITSLGKEFLLYLELKGLPSKSW